MSGSITETVFVLGEIERDLAEARRWLKDHADELVDAGVLSVRIDDTSVRAGHSYPVVVADTALRIKLQTMSRAALAATARVLAKGAGLAAVTKGLGTGDPPYPQVTRRFGRVRVVAWAAPEDVFAQSGDGWDFAPFERLLAGATS